MTITNNATIDITVNSAVAWELCKLLKLSPKNTQKFTINVTVKKEWSEMDENERYDHTLEIVKNLGTLERAKGEFRGYNVAHCRSFEEVAAVVYAAGKRERDEQKREINFPSSESSVIEWRSDGRIFVNGREGFLTSSKNPAIMLTDK